MSCHFDFECLQSFLLHSKSPIRKAIGRTGILSFSTNSWPTPPFVPKSVLYMKWTNGRNLVAFLPFVSLEGAHHHDWPSTVLRAALITQRKGCKQLRTAIQFTNIRQPVIYLIRIQPKTRTVI